MAHTSSRQDEVLLTSSSDVLPELELKLLAHIEHNPGIRYRELLRLTGLINGVLSYHIAALVRSNLIFSDRQPGQTRFFPISVSGTESTILKHLRNKAELQIMVLLLKHDVCTFSELVEYTGKAQSTVSSHLKKLTLAAVMTVRYGQYCNLYSLRNKDLVAEVLLKYKASFVDKVVDNYSEIIAEL